MKKLDVVVAGDLNADVIVSGVEWPVPSREWLAREGRISLGSSAGIFAANAARLGLRVGQVACVGADPLGDWLIEVLKRAGVETGAIVRLPRRATGFSIVINAVGKSDKAILTFKGAMSELKANQIVPVLSQARHLHLASYFLFPHLWQSAPWLLRRARRLGLTTSLDPNPDPTEAYASGIHAALQEVDYFMPNELEAQKVTRTAQLEDALRALPLLAPATIVKAGAQGAWYVDRSGSLHVAARRVRVLDPTGAGDSFDVGFLLARLQGLPVVDAIQTGARCAAKAVTTLGGATAFAKPDNAHEITEWVSARRRMRTAQARRAIA